MGARNRVGIGLSYRPARLHRLVEFILWDRFLGSINVLKILALDCWRTEESRTAQRPRTRGPEGYETKIFTVLHCKDKMPKIWNKYSQKRNTGPQSQFLHSCICERIIYSHDGYAFFCWRKYVDRSWDYINRSQTHECGNWGWVRAIPRKGIYKRNCRCSEYDWDLLAGWFCT